MRVERVDPEYRETAERLRDFAAVERQLSEEQIIKQASRCMGCGTPFCHAYACPLGNPVPEMNEYITLNHWQEALKILLSTHPFPEFTARICPALCEGSCVLGINEEAVAIRQIEKSIIEMGFEKGWIEPRPPDKRRVERVAVIGSGPAGLAAAEGLNRRGFTVTVYEKDLTPGGLLTYGIPSFKLEKQVVMRRINLMKEEGIIFECGIRAGEDISFNYLKRHYEAIILAGGSEQPRDLDIPGRHLKGIHFAMDLLKSQNKRILGEQLTPEENIWSEDKRVVVIGGGDTGSDCIGTALRQGAESVNQLEIMPRFPAERSADNPWPLWPLIDRTSSSHLEGGLRRWSVRTKSFEGNSSGEVSRLHCCDVDWHKKDGKLVPLPIRGSDFSIEADLVFLSLGFSGPGPDPLVESLNLERDVAGNIKTDYRHMTSHPGLFTAGDMARGQSLVVRAIADGMQVVDNVACYLDSKPRLGR